MIEQAKWLGVVIDKQTLLNEIKGKSSDDDDESNKAEKDFWAANDAGIQAKEIAEEAAKGWETLINDINWFYQKAQDTQKPTAFKAFVEYFQG